MRSRLRIGTLGLGLLAAAGSPLLAARAVAQVAERARVMVTNLKPLDDANKRFGRDLAKELRELINQLPRHQPVEEREVRDAAKQYDVEYDELDCIQSLQLANLVNAEIVFCGMVTENRDDRTFTLSGIQFAAPGGTSLGIADKTWDRDAPELAAQEIAEVFDTFVQQSLSADFCGQYFDSQDWESAEENCTSALAMNPDHTQVRFIYANLLKETGRLDQAYTETLRVIELDPLHEQALQLAGFLAATLADPQHGLAAPRREEMADKAREHYTSYLVLNPGNAQVRMRIAYELAQAGDPEGAMLLMEEGLAIEPDNVDLLLQHASFASRAAQDRIAAAGADAPLSAEAAELYRKAQRSYQAAYAERGIEMDSGHLRNMIAIFKELGQIEEAVEMAERVLETHDSEAQFWSLYADLLREAGRLDEAILALDETAARDPDYQNVRARQGTWLIEAGREDESLPRLQEAVENGEQTADAIARIPFAAGYAKGINAEPKDLDYALRMIGLAKTFQDELSEAAAGEIDFWHGYALYEQASEQEKPQTLQTAQRTLPKFQQAARLFAQPRVAAYAEAQSISNSLQQLRDATQQYVEIQEAIIQRGRR